MSIIKKLPGVFQTPTEKKFFEATFDQVFSKKDSDYLSGYLGRRQPGEFDPKNDFYVPEPDKDRTWWQLEATAYAENTDTTRSNIFFYSDLLNKIKSYGGNISNQDRLFSSEYYSWQPPIDVDMFVNYQNYYWIEHGLATIQITGVLGTDIIGNTVFTTPSTATPANFTLTSGMKVHLLSDLTNYPNPVIIENIGKGVGIRLVPVYLDYNSGTILEFLPWDNKYTLLDNSIIDNSQWDSTPWEMQPKPGNSDYMTSERGSVDGNAWSRSNKWYHIDAITQSAGVTNTIFPPAARAALRPIIQFEADLTMYKSGTRFNSSISHGFTTKIGTTDNILHMDCNGVSVTSFLAISGADLINGDTICFFNDTSLLSGTVVNSLIFIVSISAGIITLIPYATVESGDSVVISNNNNDINGIDNSFLGKTYYYTNTVSITNLWQEVFNDKYKSNQPPLFQLFDFNDIPLDDTNTYPYSTFEGSNIFSYNVDSTPGAYVDPVLGFPIVYTSLNQASDIIFLNNLITDRYTYNINTQLSGYYYYKKIGYRLLRNAWNLYMPENAAVPLPPPPPPVPPVYGYYTSVLYPYLTLDTLGVLGQSVTKGVKWGGPTDTLLVAGQSATGGTLVESIIYVDYTDKDTLSVAGQSATGGTLVVTFNPVTYNNYNLDNLIVAGQSAISGTLI